MAEFNLDTFITNLSKQQQKQKLDTEPSFERSPSVEIVIDKKTGLPRQAGATTAEGKAINDFRIAAEQSLYVFCKGVLGFDRLTPSLHGPACDFLQTMPPHKSNKFRVTYHKGMLLPRDHYKTSIGSRGMSMHMMIQPKETNIYKPNFDGCNFRILLSNKTSANAEKFLRFIATKLETCQLLRALWPHRVWDDPRKQSKKWNEKELLLPRTQDFSEASIESIGVGGAVTSRHYSVMIEDDLIDIEDANSPTVMRTAIDWHNSGHALLDDQEHDLVYVIGTRWAVGDLYEHIQTTDDSFAWHIRGAIEDGKPILPEMFSLETLQTIQKKMGPLFFLLYMNNAVNPELTDFDLEAIREFCYDGSFVSFAEDHRDLDIANVLRRPTDHVVEEAMRGVRFTPEVQEVMARRNEYLTRFRIR